MGFLFGVVALVCVGIISIATLPNETPRRRLMIEKKITVYCAGSFAPSLNQSSVFQPDETCTFSRSRDGTFSYFKKDGQKDYFYLQIVYMGLSTTATLKIKDITSVNADVDVDGKTELLQFKGPDDINFVVSGLDKEWVKETILSCYDCHLKTNF